MVGIKAVRTRLSHEWLATLQTVKNNRNIVMPLVPKSIATATLVEDQYNEKLTRAAALLG